MGPKFRHPGTTWKVHRSKVGCNPLSLASSKLLRPTPTTYPVSNRVNRPEKMSKSVPGRFQPRILPCLCLNVRKKPADSLTRLEKVFEFAKSDLYCVPRWMRSIAKKLTLFLVFHANDCSEIRRGE